MYLSTGDTEILISNKALVIFIESPFPNVLRQDYLVRSVNISNLSKYLELIDLLILFVRGGVKK